MRRSFVFGVAMVSMLVVGGCGSTAPDAGNDDSGTDRGKVDQSSDTLSGDTRVDAVGADGPRADGPRADGPRADGPRADGPRADGPGKVDGPRADAPANCGKLGDKIKLGQPCCPGLTKGAVATPPSCISIGQTFVCVSCGDGKCDTAAGEDACSCAKDCKTTTVTECAKNGGYCAVQFTPCKAGYTLDSSLSCNAKALQCCMPSKCVGVTCPLPSCKMSVAGDCTETSHQCDASTGGCIKKAKTVLTSCTMSGSSCVQSTPSCSSNATCAITATMLARSCKQSGNTCVQSTPSCSKNSCSTKIAFVVNATCNVLTGSCKSGGCKVDCDCKQGWACVGKGQCVVPLIPVYCCDKGGCPVGKKCTGQTGASGTCPSTLTACQKKGGYCTLQFAKCLPGYIDDPASCGGALSLTCCVPSP